MPFKFAQRQRLLACREVFFNLLECDEGQLDCTIPRPDAATTNGTDESAVGLGDGTPPLPTAAAQEATDIA